MSYEIGVGICEQVGIACLVIQSVMNITAMPSLALICDARLVTFLIKDSIAPGLLRVDFHQKRC